MKRNRSTLPTYTIRKKLLALLLASFYLLQPLQGTIVAGFHDIIHVLEAPDNIIGHHFQSDGLENIHRSGEHTMLHSEKNNLAARIWASLTETNGEEPCALPEPIFQDKHTKTRSDIHFKTWVLKTNRYAQPKLMPKIVLLAVPDEPPRLV